MNSDHFLHISVLFGPSKAKVYHSSIELPFRHQGVTELGRKMTFGVTTSRFKTLNAIQI